MIIVKRTAEWRGQVQAEYWDDEPFDEMLLVGIIGALRSQRQRQTDRRWP